jgi:pSer/pThr/pTyr-binding forkhead associated (FHA) protein
MSHSLLSILRFSLLAAIWLFFVYAARMVWVEVRRSRVEPAQVSPVPASAPVVADKPLVLRLRVVDPPQRRGRVFELGDEVTVGRSPGCAVPLDDDTFASSIHARVFARGGELWIEDLGSTNGTWVNEARLEAPTRLARGDRVKVGSTMFEVAK